MVLFERGEPLVRRIFKKSVDEPGIPCISYVSFFRNYEESKP